jgi:hydroxymethylbilane synthase
MDMSDTAPLRLGTRRSPMATAQSQMIADRLTELTGRPVELVGVTTFGDVTKANLAQLGGTGVFVGALREKLIEGEIDFAVHSLKDLPTKPQPGVTLAATPPRHDPRDALIGPHKLPDLPPGSRVGTGSPRRVAQLRMLRPDLDYVPIRGNADTRIGKVHAGELDAIVLPAPGQGSLAVECPQGRADLIELLGVLDHPPTRAAVTAERAVLAALEAGCAAPVGAYAVAGEHTLNLTAVVVAVDGVRAVRKSAAGHPARAMELGRDLAATMIAQGAGMLMGEQTH